MKSILLSLIGSFISLIPVVAQLTDTTQNLQIYKLGEVLISSPKASETLNVQTAQEQTLKDVSSAIDLMPSVTFALSGSRNETGVYVKGFDMRSIPVFVDGVPMYVPYDGSIDLGRFKIWDYSKIDVTSGLSPMAYGANTMGGAINLVSKKPVYPFEVQAQASLESGKEYSYGLQLGSKLKKFYFQAAFNRQQQDYFNLSKNYKRISRNEDGGARENSWFEDQSFNLKAGFTPNSTDEYSLNYSYLNSARGVAPYAGTDPLMKTRFWQWPVWKKQNLYYVGKTHWGKKTVVKSLLSYNKFDNTLKSFNDSLYTLQTKPYAFTSYYDDYALYGGMVMTTKINAKNTLNFSIHDSYDVHAENNEGDPQKHFTDNTLSIGLDHIFEYNAQLKATFGLSYNLRNGILAEEYLTATQEINTLPKSSNSNFNYQLAVDYKLHSKISLGAFYAHKTHLATMKDRYSYKNGIAIPNPDLKSEIADHYEVNYQHTVNSKFNLRSSLFYIHLKNAILLVSEVQPGKAQMQNAGYAEFMGADFSAQYQFLKWAGLQASYSYIERKNLSHPEVKFMDVPESNLTASLDLKPIKHLQILFAAEVNSFRYSTSYGIKAAGFDRYDLHLSTDIVKYLIIRAGVRNLFDKNYEYCEGFAAEGRNFYLSLGFNFQR